MTPGAELFPESVKVLGWLGGAGFTVWIFKMAFDMFRGVKGGPNGTRKVPCIDSPFWVRHDELEKAMAANVKEMAVAMALYATSAGTQAKAMERQSELLEEIADNTSKP